jgi:hypothetical protein
MRDVHVAARDGVFLCVSYVMVCGHHAAIMLTVKAPIVKYLRGGTSVASPTRLGTSVITMSQAHAESLEAHTLTVFRSTAQVYLGRWQSRNPKPL